MKTIVVTFDINRNSAKQPQDDIEEVTLKGDTHANFLNKMLS
jgi:hypothetical protein